jgi:NADPH:quinone reductase-like Zn-dependent oxidoreductase
MKAIVVTDRAAEAAGITLAERPEPTPAINDVVVEVHASGFVPAEWEWPSTWVDRSGHDRAQAIIGHELAGVVTSLGYGTTGLSLGQRVFGITDWHREGRKHDQSHGNAVPRTPVLPRPPPRYMRDVSAPGQGRMSEQVRGSGVAGLGSAAGSVRA